MGRSGLPISMPIRHPPFVTGCHYHLYNRGVAKQPIFLDKRDYKKFISYMFAYRYFAHAKDVETIRIECYALMPNHFHLLVKQVADDGIVHYLQRFLTAYSMHYNYCHDRVGPLYQGRTKAKWIHDEGYFKEISRYIHRNPIKLFDHPQPFLDYPYSNLQYYLKDKRAENSILLSFFQNSAEQYEKFVLQLQTGSPDLPF